MKINPASGLSGSHQGAGQFFQCLRATGASNSRKGGRSGGRPGLDVDFPQSVGAAQGGSRYPDHLTAASPKPEAKAPWPEWYLCPWLGQDAMASGAGAGVACNAEGIAGCIPCGLCRPRVPGPSLPHTFLLLSLSGRWLWVSLTSPWRGFILYPVGHSFPGWDCANRISGIYSPTVPEARHLHPRRWQMVFPPEARAEYPSLPLRVSVCCQCSLVSLACGGVTETSAPIPTQLSSLHVCVCA